MAAQEIKIILDRVIIITTTATTVFAAGVFIYSGLTKVMNVEDFAKVLKSHQLLTDSGVSIASNVFPVIEILTGIFGLVVVTRRRWVAIGGAAFAILLLAIGGYSLGVAAHPPAAPTHCGCGFGSRMISDWRSIALRSLACSGVFSLVSAFAFIINSVENKQLCPQGR